MNTIKCAFEVAYKTYQQNISLSQSLRKYFDIHVYALDDRKVIKKICINFFRNSLSFKEVLDDAFPNLRANEFFILGCSLADYVFVKSMPLEENLEYVLETLKSNKSNLSLDMINRLYDRIHGFNGLIPDSVEPDSKHYIALKYNIPDWCVKLWSKHYGDKIALKLIEHTRKIPYQTFRVNNLKTDYKSLINSGNNFIPGHSLSYTTVIYHSSKDWKLLDAFQEGKIIPITDGLNHIINKLHLRHFDNVLVVDYANVNAHLALAESSSDKAKIILYRETEDLRYNALKQIRACGFENIETAGGPLTRLFTYVSTLQDIVFLAPKSTNFNAINKTPDFFFHLRQNDLDNIIQNEFDMLEEGAKYVINNGLLVYAIETANNKEGNLLIKEFLDLHSEFKMVEQRQTLQFDKRGTSFYYAVLRKMGK